MYIYCITIFLFRFAEHKTFAVSVFEVQKMIAFDFAVFEINVEFCLVELENRLDSLKNIFNELTKLLQVSFNASIF